MFIVKEILQIFNLMMLNKVTVMCLVIVLSGSGQENRNILVALSIERILI